jgi:hypothetical protein
MSVAPRVTNHQGSVKHVNANMKKLKEIQIQLERLKNSNSIIVVPMTQFRNFGDFMKLN